MLCYRLENNKALKGFSKTLFPVENAEAEKGIIAEASVSLIIPEEIDLNIFHEEIKQNNTDCYQFGEAWLRKPRKKPTKDLLVCFDWTYFWPDRNLGDTSTLVTWNETCALYVCRPGTTFIRNRNTGDIFVNKKGALTKIPASQYEELRSAHDKRLTIASVKESNVLLDYILE